jgi:hypothetical protein
MDVEHPQNIQQPTVWCYSILGMIGGMTVPGPTGQGPLGCAKPKLPSEQLLRRSPTLGVHPGFSTVSMQGEGHGARFVCPINKIRVISLEMAPEKTDRRKSRSHTEPRTNKAHLG